MPDLGCTPTPRLLGGRMSDTPGWVQRRLAFLAVTEPLDFAGAIEFLEPALSRGGTPRCLVVDLERCEWADPSGFRALLRLRDRLNTAGGKLRLVVPLYSRISTTLAFFGLRSRLKVHATLPEACAELAMDLARENPGGGSQEAC